MYYYVLRKNKEAKSIKEIAGQFNVTERIIKRALEQEAAGNYLLKIINSIEKQNNDAYLAEREKQEQRKREPYENGNCFRQIGLELKIFIFLLLLHIAL